ncbi:MAG: FGGY family carbohydrate kinase [Ignisphaera sp.]
MNIATIDLGTTNIKISIVSIDEKELSIQILDSISRKLSAYTPAPKVHEHNPHEIRKSVSELLQHLSHKHRIDAVVLSTYLFATVIVDRTLKPLTNIVTWLDERACRYVKLIEDRASELYQRTGCPPIHIYTLSKILWLKHEKPELLHNNLILDSKSLLTGWLLGYPVTDLSTASGTYQMLNIAKLNWDPLALEIAGIDENQLPELREAYFTDTINGEVSREIGLEPRTPLILGLFDGGSMVYGLSRGRRDTAVVNLGTSAMLRTVIDRPVIDASPNMVFQTYYMMDKLWLSGGAINNAGIVVEYLLKLLNLDFSVLRDVLGLDPPDPGQTPITIPLLYPERLPRLPQGTRLSIYRITSSTTYEHILWGVVDGILMLLKLIDESLHINGVGYREMMVGGGLSQYMGILKAMSSLFNKRLGVVRGVEASHLGQILLSLRVLGGSELERSFITVIESSIEYFEPSRTLYDLYSKKFTEFKNILTLHMQLYTDLQLQ